VSVGVVYASGSVVADILTIVNDSWTSDRAVLRARSRRVGLIAHSGLRIVSPVETEANIGVLPSLAVRTLLIGVISAVSQVIAVCLAAVSLSVVEECSESGSKNESHICLKRTKL
jgi:hypothetical protein